MRSVFSLHVTKFGSDHNSSLFKRTERHQNKMAWTRIFFLVLLLGLLNLDFTNGRRFSSSRISFSSRGSRPSSSGRHSSTSHSTSHGTSHGTSHQPVHTGNKISSQQHNIDSSTRLIHSESSGQPRPNPSHPAVPSHVPSAPPPPVVHTKPLASAPPILGTGSHPPTGFNPGVHPNNNPPPIGFNPAVHSNNNPPPIGFNPAVHSNNNPPPIGFKPAVHPPTNANPHSPANPHNPSYPSNPSYPHNPSYPPHPMPLPPPHAPYPPVGMPHPGHSAPHLNNPSFPVTNNYPHTFNAPHYPGISPNTGHNIPGPTYYPQQQQQQQIHYIGQPAAQPFVPGQTTIFLPNQQSSGRGLGDMFKEALVFSTVNAAVNRVINPHHHYYESRPASSDGSDAGKTYITYNNHYINNYPGNMSSGTVGANNLGSPPNQAPNPATPYNPSNPSTSYNPSNPTTMITNNPGTPNPSISVLSTSNINTPTNGTNTYQVQRNNANQQTNAVSNSAGLSQYYISDDELYKISEEIFAEEEHDIMKYITLNLQARFIPSNTTGNITDVAPGSLFLTKPEVYDIPSIKVIRTLYDNYERNASKKENRTREVREQENLFLDTILNTNVMSTAMNWLSNRNFINPDDFERKDILRRIWFTQFNGSSSGFERILMSEIYGNTDLLGVQDWIYFDKEELAKRINYMGYVDKFNFGNKASLLKLNFEMAGIVKPNATIFVGTSPELEISLYTICFYARPNNFCPVSLGNTKFNIYTHAFRYYGTDLIDLAVPFI